MPSDAVLVIVLVIAMFRFFSVLLEWASRNYYGMLGRLAAPQHTILSLTGEGDAGFAG